MEALNETFEIGLPLNETSELRRVAREYSRNSNGHINNVASAIHGWVRRARCPKRDEAMLPAHYRSRKGLFGVAVTAGCESNLRFNVFSAKRSGATHDSLAWEVASAKRLIIDDKSLLTHELFSSVFLSCSQTCIGDESKVIGSVKELMWIVWWKSTQRFT